MTENLYENAIPELLVENTQKVFSVMLGMEVAPLPVQTQRYLEGPEGGVVSLIGMVGGWIGSGSLCCSSEVACKISGRLLMAEYDSVNEDVLDAVGELTNMIIGNFKDEAEPLLGPLALNTPTVVYGRNFRARNLAGTLWTTVPFETEYGNLEVKVCIAPAPVSNCANQSGLVVAGR